MTLHRSISVALIACYFFAPATRAAEIPDRLMQGTIYYDAKARGNAAAYSRVAYYRANGHSNDRLLEILQLEYALKAGLSSTSQVLLDRSKGAQEPGKEIPANKLSERGDKNTATPLNQTQRDRLNFVLARHAYKNKDWLGLASRYSQLSEDSNLQGTTTGIFLGMEMARVTGSFDTANKLLGKLPESHILRRYGQFNLAAALYGSGDTEKSLMLLDELTTLKNTTFEQLMIAQRSQLILGQMALQQGRLEEAGKRLSNISAEGLYGDVALVALAQLKLADEQPEQAIDIWHHVTANFPQTSRTRVAYLGLAHATEEFYGPDSALVEYTNLASVLYERSQELDRHLLALDAMDIESLVQETTEAVWLESTTNESATDKKEINNTTRSLLLKLLSEQSNRSTVDQWRQLSNTLSAARIRSDDIDILRRINAEQVRRADQARKILQQNHYTADLNRYQEIVNKIITAARTEISTGFQPDQIPRLASDNEKLVLSRLFEIREQFLEKGMTKPQIEMMIGKIQYDIYSDLPIRIREKHAAAEKLLTRISGMTTSINRINAAAGHQGNIRSISQQLESLDTKASYLLLVAEQRLKDLGDQLIANLKQSILLEQELVRRDLNEVNLAVVRIKDNQLLTMGERQ